ncbi:MAG: sigma-54-dependent Fis family transcriptional regulator [Spirochaetales bacterium]|nr:sigma-54-dependent Fis family transcriptional regulator [Spirochaetales bacterium]
MNAYHSPEKPVLIVDDEQEILDGYDMALNKRGITNLSLCRDSRKVMSLLSERSYAVVILDLSMPYVSGQELIDLIRENYPEIPLVVITASKDIDTAIDCVQKGVYDYMIKPVEINRLVSNIKRAVELGQLQEEVKRLGQRCIKRDLEKPEAFSHIVTSHESILSIFRYVEAIAGSPKPVIITGESGVGKELVAQAIHTVSGRTGPFVPVNIAGLDDTMFADTLFGHKKGAFTGADSERRGFLKEAEGGILFLDEIGDLEEKSQVKLLRFLQENQYYPLGSDKAVTSHVRIIVATNTDLKEKYNKGAFRKDLYYRLMTHYIHVPPLRERLSDIPLLADYFIEKACQSLHKKKPEISDDFYSLLATYHYPGNVRELESILYNAMSLSKGGSISTDAIESYIGEHTDASMIITDDKRKSGGKKILGILTSNGELPTLKEMEEFLLKKALEKSHGNQSLAAPILGLTPSTLSRRLKKLS